jgi:hypothetical protein
MIFKVVAEHFKNVLEQGKKILIGFELFVSYFEVF